MLRDREFCSAPHRKSYKDRLGRALHQIAEETVAPPPPAPFRTSLTPQGGRCTATFALWQHGTNYRYYGLTHWPLALQNLAHLHPRDLGLSAISASEARTAAMLEAEENWVHEAAYPELSLAAVLEDKPATAPVQQSEQDPPLCSKFARSLQPEATERWLSVALASPSFALRASAASLDALPGISLHATPRLSGFEAPPAPEAAAAWIASSAELVPAPMAATDLTRGLAVPALDTTPDAAGWLPIPAPEAAAAWITTSAELVPAAIQVTTDFTRGLAVPGLDVTPDVAGWLQVPAPEAAAAWVAAAAALAAVVSVPQISFGGLLGLPPLDSTLEAPAEVEEIPEPCGWATASPAEPAMSWIAAACAPEPAATVPQITFADILALPEIDLTRSVEIEACGWAVAPQAEPAAAFVAPTAVLAPAVFAAHDLEANLALPVLAAAVEFSHDHAPLELEPAAAIVPADITPLSATLAPCAPEFTLSAELEPVAPAAEFLEIPAWCEQLMPALQPEPVWSFLQASSASELQPALAQARPVLSEDILHTHIPVATSPQRGLQAEPVMAGVWPRMAEVPVENIESERVFQFPGSSAAPAARAGFALAPPAVERGAEPIEVPVISANPADTVSGNVPLHMPSAAALNASGTGSLALPAAGPQAEAAERLLTAAEAAPLAPARPAELQQFALEGSTNAAIPQPELPTIAARVSKPAAAVASAAKLTPLPVMRLTLPVQQHRQISPAIPRPGLLAIEYHTQRTRGAAYSRPEWKSVSYQPIPPAFGLTPVLENPEQLIKPQEPLKGVFPINKSKKWVNRAALMEHILKVAAAVLVVASIWTAGTALRTARRVTVRPTETAFATPGQVLSPEAQNAMAKKAAESKGPLNWMRKSIANRASVQVADDFQGGMEKWGAAPGTMASNWRRHHDGYVLTGALALLTPTTKFTDYKLEFYGQIDQKAIGWVVRAKDDKNYHAMKFTTLEKGLRPIIAMVHYDVIDGKAGRKFEMPLNVMVHNNKAIQVAVTVKGKHFITEVDGEAVDTFSEDALPSGGVGFFSEVGEQAHLYWARVTKNDDWLGHVCAFLSGGEAEATADLRGPGFPGGGPAPWTPASDSLISAAWIGLPSIRRTHSSPRRKRRCNR